MLPRVNRYAKIWGYPQFLQARGLRGASGRSLALGAFFVLGSIALEVGTFKDMEIWVVIKKIDR